MFYFNQKSEVPLKKFKNQPQPLLRTRSVNFRQHFRNLSHKTVPLIGLFSSLAGGEWPDRCDLQSLEGQPVLPLVMSNQLFFQG